MIVMDDQTTEKAGSGFWAARPRPVQPLSESGRKIRRDARGGRVTALLIILTENNKKATKIHGRLGPAWKEKIFGGRRRKGTGTVDTLHETRPVDPGKYNQMTKKIFRKIPISALKFIQNDDRLQVVRRGNRLGPPWVLPVFT